MKFLILTGHNKEYAPVTNTTFPNKIEYCRRYGYDLQYIDEDVGLEVSAPPKPEFRDARNHNKMCLISHWVSQSIYDWIVWIDGDAMIMNMSLPLSNFIGNKYGFIIGKDWNGLNSGVCFFKSCPETMLFINKCINYQPTDYDKTQAPWWWWPSEQCAYTRCLNYINAKVVHHSLFNGYINRIAWHNDWRHQNIGSYDFTERAFQHGDFILHLVGSHMHEKLNTLPQLEKMVIR